MAQAPTSSTYDVVIIGGAMIGSSVAWFTASNPDFQGSILVVERDPSFEFSSTARTNSCMRQQFSAEVNIRISQFAAEYVKTFRDQMGGDERVPEVLLQSYGYMYLAADDAFAATLKAAQAIQQNLGAGTKHMTRDEIAAAYPFYHLDDIIAANHNLVDEGYFDGGTLFEWWRRKGVEAGVERIDNAVVAMTCGPEKIESVTLATGEVISAGIVVNCAGPRAALVAQMAGLDLPVVPRKRYTYIFTAEQPLDRDLPLTIDPSGVHMRSDGRNYLAGCPPDVDPDVAPDDFVEDHTLWEQKVWPVLAHRVPAFERIRLQTSWVGHYAFNTLDQNAILGFAEERPNLLFVNGFSGHGFQQSPAMGRGASELIAYGEFRALDLSAFSPSRIAKGEPFRETAII